MSLRAELYRVIYEKGKPMSIRELVDATGKGKPEVWRVLLTGTITHHIRKLEVDERFHTKFRWELTELGIKQHLNYLRGMMKK